MGPLRETRSSCLSSLPHKADFLEDKRVARLPSVQAILAARIDRLPEEVKHTLQVAAVIGRRFQVELLETVLRGMA